MLQAAPAQQLEAVIARTVVPRQHRRVFLGKAAAAMLAALGLGQAGCPGPARTGSRPDFPEESTSKGIRPDHPAVTGIEPDMPGPNASPQDGSAEDAAEPDQVGEGPSDDQSEDSPPDQTIRGIRPDRVPAPTGSRPDLPPSAPE